MKTLELFATKPEMIPAQTSWYLADLGEARGRQELFTTQSPQKLKVLHEHALIESTVSSNRIEGVTVDQSRVATLIFGRPHLRDRDEEELRGYRDALNLIHTQGAPLPLDEALIPRLHALARGRIADAGKYKEQDGNIIETYPDGRTRVRFRTVPAAETPKALRRSIALWKKCLDGQWVHPLIALAGFNLDFLCIHPFRDGNGRVSRLLILLQLYQLGYEVGRYISLERLIEENKSRYYETLEASSQRWHEGKHDPWPYINYLLCTFKVAYREFEERVGQLKSPYGAKTEIVRNAVLQKPREFSITEIERICPGVSRDMIRKVMRDLQRAGEIECLGTGRNARWRKRG